MKLRNIILSFRDSLDEFETTFNHNVQFINWYLSKSIRKLNTDVPYNVNKLVIQPTFIRSECCCFVPENSLNVVYRINEEDKQKYLALTRQQDKYEFYLSLLEQGYKIASESFNLPVGVFLSLHRQFRENNYTTEWIFKKIFIKELGIRVALRCTFTTYDFCINIDVVEHKSKKIINTTILWQTPPHYLCFDKGFKRVSRKDGKIIILDFLNEPHFEIDEASLLSKEPVIKYNYGNKVEEPEFIHKLKYDSD